MKISRQVGTTNEVLAVFIQDYTVSTGAGLANVSSSSVNFAWCRNNQTAISSGICTAGGAIGTYSVSTLTQLSSTSTLGWYHFSPPDVLFLSGRSAILHLYGYPNMAPVPIEVELTATNNQTIQPVGVSSASVNFGVSTLATSVSSVTGLVAVSSLQTSVSSVTGLVAVSSLQTSVSSVTGAVHVSSFGRQVGVSSATVDFGVSTIAVAEKLVGVSTIAAAQKLVGVSSITALATSSIATGVWSTSTAADFTTADSVGKALYNAFGANTSVYTAASLANAPNLPVGVTSISVPVGVSSASVNLGVSTLATSVSSVTGSVDVSSASVLLGVSTLATSVDVSSSIMVSSNTVQMNGATVQGDGTAGNLWRG